MEKADILIVEDDTDIRDALTEILQSEGYAIAGVTNGREALDYLRSHPSPKLILLDLMMPVMNGGEFRLEQKSDANLAKIPVFILSAANEDRHREEISDVQGFLKKPLHLESLLKAVRQYC